MRQKKTKQMLDYWMSLYQEAGSGLAQGAKPVWPERSAVQPAECRSLLSNMFILELSGGAARYRLAGTNLCGIYGRELKNEDFCEAYTGKDQKSADTWAKQLGQDGTAVLICSLAEADSGDLVNLETLLLPLSHHGDPSKRVLGLTVSCEEPTWLGAYPIIGQHIRSARILRPWNDRTKMKGPSLTTPITARETRASDDQNVLDGYFKPTAAEPVQSDIQPSVDQSSFGESFSFMNRAPFVSHDEANGAFESARKFGHLHVIDGGRQD